MDIKDYKWTVFTLALILGLLLALVCNPPKEDVEVKPSTMVELFGKTSKAVEPKPMNMKDVYMIYQMYFDEDLILLQQEIAELESRRELDQY